MCQTCWFLHFINKTEGISRSLMFTLIDLSIYLLCISMLGGWKSLQEDFGVQNNRTALLYITYLIEDFMIFMKEIAFNRKKTKEIAFNRPLENSATIWMQQFKNHSLQESISQANYKDKQHERSERIH